MIFKEIIDDYKEERFTWIEWVVYGICIPILFLLLILTSEIYLSLT